MWSLQGSARSGASSCGRRQPLARHLPSSGTGQGSRPLGSREIAGPVRPARRLGDRARQRWLDHVLGRRDVRPDRTPQPAPRVRRVLVEVRGRCRRGAASRRAGRHRVDAGDASCSLERETTSTCTHSRTTRRRLASRCRWRGRSVPMGSSWWTRPRLRADCAGRRPRSTCTTSRRRSASRPTVACGSRPAHPRPSARIERIASSRRWCPASLDLSISAREQPARSDLQHARPGNALPARPAAAMDERRRRARVRRLTVGRVGRDPLRVGREVAVRHAVRR